MSYVPVYVNDSGDMWVERGKVSWPRARREAANMAREMGDPWSVSAYEGIQKGVRVSDMREEPHMDDEACDDAQDGRGERCCRTIDAYAFRSVER